MMNKIYKAFQSITPNEFEKIEDHLKYRNEEVIVNMENKRKPRYRFALVAVTCMLVLTVPFLFKNQNQVFATIGVDVNPSVELNIDKDERVVDVIAHNDDGKTIIGDMKLDGSDLNVAMNALIGSMLKEGYIDELKNSLLISVTGDNEKENERLRQELSQNIDQFLKGSHIEGSVVSQTLKDNQELETLAKKYQISKGKAEIIQQLIQKNSLYTFEGLKDLSVNDLNILLKSNQVEQVNVSGKASTGQYLSVDKVKQIVEADAKVSKPTYQKLELDYDDGIMVYEVEFVKDSVEYEYELHATSGKILEKEKESHQSKPQSSTQTSSSQTLISKDEAKKIAMKNAGVSTVTNYKIEKEKDDGVWEYEIEFVSNNKEHDYTIRASDGKILSHETKTLKSVKITHQQAQDKALRHANLSKSQVKELEVDLEDEGYYEVSFKYDIYEYEYEIDGTSGNIIHHEKEKD